MDTMTFIGTATSILRLGAFTVLTDPNFLHRGQAAYLGKGLFSRRLTDPAIGIGELPPLDAVVLSHLHGDHFDRVARRHLDRSAPVLTTPEAASRLTTWGFAAEGLSTWQTRTLERDGERLTVQSVPGIHARGLLRRVLPPVMGSLLTHEAPGSPARTLYLSGDTLTGDHLDQIAQRAPALDAAVLHLGGTRVLLHTVTMDDRQGVDALQRLSPAVALPVHYDDYGVFRSPLSAFLLAARRAGLGDLVRVPGRGEQTPLF